MIVCSCNRLSDKAIRGCCAGVGAPVRVLDVYGRLGCQVQCGRCATSIAAIMREAGKTTCRCGPETCGPETCKCESGARGDKAA